MCATAFSIIVFFSPVHFCWTSAARTISDMFRLTLVSVFCCPLLLRGRPLRQGQRQVQHQPGPEADRPAVGVEGLEERDQPVRREGPGGRAAGVFAPPTASTAPAAVATTACQLQPAAYQYEP